MTNITTVKTMESSFARQLNGYDKEQVNDYIEHLSEAYETAYQEYNAVCAKYNALLEDYTKLEDELDAGKASASAIAKSLVNAEAVAEKVISDANEQAENTKAKALAEAEMIRSDAYVEKLAAKRSIELSNEYLEQLISKLQGMVAA